MNRLRHLLLIGLSCVLCWGAAAEEKNMACENIPGKADAMVLALNWQPAFCETVAGREKAECRVESPTAYQATNFVLHGLWPNQKKCSAPNYYAFCGPIKESRPHCKYPEVEMNIGNRATLAEVMPSVRAGTCLERHEWFKHGTCMASTTPDHYFRLAERLTREFNQSGMADYMAYNMGKRVAKLDFMYWLELNLGRWTAKRVKLTCNKDNLSDLEILLPAKVTTGESLVKLLSKVKVGTIPATNCGDSFRIDPIGPNS